MNQSQLEYLLHPYHIQQDLQQLIAESFTDKISKAVNVIKKWCDIDEKSELKNQRKQILRCLDLNNIVIQLISTILTYCQEPLPFVSVASMLNIGYETKMENVRTVSELLALLEPLEIYTIGENKDIQSLLTPPDEIYNRIKLACYIPPMITKPNKLYKNNDCGLLTINNDSLILGDKENYHKGNISLDVLNILNSNEYVIDDYIVNNFQKEFHLDTPQDIINKEVFLDQFNVFYKHLKDKTVYFTHKVDKRGRVYSCGYHFNTQGTSFEKACISLSNQELVTGEL